MVNVVRVVTWNLCDFTRPDIRDTTRGTGILHQLAALNGEVYAVQEIMGDTPEDRIATFVALAAELRLACHVPDVDGHLVPAFDPGRGLRGVGLMWRDDRVRPVPGSLRVYDRSQLSVGMVVMQAWVDGVLFAFASTHLTARLLNWREDEARYVGTEVSGAGPYAVVGADWNNVFASRRKGTNTFYDHPPYERLPWQPSCEFVGKARRDPVTGWPVTQRNAMAVLEDCGLVDPAAHIDAPPYRTTGHWDQHAVTKRIDGPFVTPAVAGAVVSITSVDDDDVTAAPRDQGGLSDHLPVVLEIDLDQLAGRTLEWADQRREIEKPDLRESVPALAERIDVSWGTAGETRS